MGVFGLVRGLRRRRRLQRAFPAAWEPIIAARLPFAARFVDDEARRFRDHLKIFVWEKIFRGIDLEVTEEMRVVIGGSAARLVRNLPHGLYDAIDTVLVRSSAIEHEGGRVLGYVHSLGTLLLSWDAVKHGIATSNDGHDTAVHELAHVIDLKDGLFDGTPTFDGGHDDVARAWAGVFSRHYLALKDAPERGVLRAYGATNEAEFFAVATEVFFEKPRVLKRKAPKLYDALAAYYRVTPE
ncbi:MAG: zinc-dependent peptidase [Deltaproteobacteria bacterium]|nr:zinc-dependent peptidase [Deltaproteobacteria bacterium]